MPLYFTVINRTREINCCLRNRYTVSTPFCSPTWRSACRENLRARLFDLPVRQNESQCGQRKHDSVLCACFPAARSGCKKNFPEARKPDVGTAFDFCGPPFLSSADALHGFRSIGFCEHSACEQNRNNGLFSQKLYRSRAGATTACAARSIFKYIASEKRLSTGVYANVISEENVAVASRTRPQQFHDLRHRKREKFPKGFAVMLQAAFSAVPPASAVASAHNLATLKAQGSVARGALQSRFLRAPVRSAQSHGTAHCPACMHRCAHCRRRWRR